MQTELGTITHHYWWNNGNYFRRAIAPIGVYPARQVWNGKQWIVATIACRMVA